MTLNGSPDNRNDLADRKRVPGAWRRSLALGLLAMLIAAISGPEPALAQWDSMAGAVAGAMVRGMVGGGGGGYYSNGGGRRYHGGGRSRSHVAHATRAKPTHVASHHERPAPAHHASSGGHTASSGASEPAGPGGGSFH
jgi:hypothetical protein